MLIALIADAFPPMKTSGAVQVHDLVMELASKGHQVTVILPDATLSDAWQREEMNGVVVLRLKAPATKDVSFARRAYAEFRLSGMMYRQLKCSLYHKQRWDGIVWYSPSIFFGSLVSRLKQESGCRTYLILRDIFPEWAVDMGILKRGMIYRYFKKVERFQYLQASTIGIQTDSVRRYFKTSQTGLPANIEVLNNWLEPSAKGSCSIDLSSTALKGRQIFVYSGNMGIAQGMDILIQLSERLSDNSEIGFVFVGRGSAVTRLKRLAAEYHLDNVLFFDGIPSVEIPGLLAQCQVGLIALDPRHSNDNIPGKFLAYMQAGLPVLANINPGNDLATMIAVNEVGEVVTSNSLEELTLAASKAMNALADDPGIRQRCLDLAHREFSPARAAKQIIMALQQT